MDVKPFRRTLILINIYHDKNSRNNYRANFTSQEGDDMMRQVPRDPPKKEDNTGEKKTKH